MRTRLAVLAAILATGVAAPAFAGSSNDDQTTAAKLDEVGYVINEDQPTAAKLDEVVFRTGTFSAASMVPRVVDYSDDPDRTGGGSSGYNSHVRHDYTI